MLFEGAYMKKFAAGIVSYNPDISRLKENIETIRKQCLYLCMGELNWYFFSSGYSYTKCYKTRTIE